MKKPIPYREHTEPHTRTRYLGQHKDNSFYQYADLDDTPDERVLSLHEYYELDKNISAWVWAVLPSRLRWRICINDTDFGDYESLRLAIEAFPKCWRRYRAIKRLK